jgi:hypothetical protein
VIDGWEYRALWGTSYTWGKVERFENAQAIWNSYKRVGSKDGVFATKPRVWGREVGDDRNIYRNAVKVGTLMGRVQYKNIEVTLDVTRGANDKHTIPEWEAIAASARVPGARKRPVRVYLAENGTDDVICAIARGGA